MTTDTANTCNPAPHFGDAGFQVIYGSNPNTAGPARHVYIPSDEAKRWDGADAATHAVGSHRGGYCYAIIRETGRGARYFTGWNGPLVKARITIAVGTEDEQIIDGWVTQ